VLSGIIESIENDRAQLRNAIYELARIQLQRIAWQRNPPMNVLEMRRLMLALETAIERVETVSSQHDSPRELSERLSLAAEINRQQSLAYRHERNRLIDYSSRQTAEATPEHAVSVPNTVGLQRRNKNFRRPALVVQGLTASIAILIIFIVFKWQDLDAARPNLSEAIVPNMPIDLPQARSVVDRPTTDAARLPPTMSVVPPQPKLSVQAEAIGTQLIGLGWPRPTVYGVYAIANGELIELDTLPGRVPDVRVFMSAIIRTPSRIVLPAGQIGFIAYRRDIASSAPDRVTIRAIAKIRRALTYDAAGRAKTAALDDEWAIRNVSYEFRVAPSSESSEMLVIRSDQPDFVLPPGRYALVLKGQAYDFNVAGPITAAAQCLERVEAANGAFYSECRSK